MATAEILESTALENIENGTATFSRKMSLAAGAEYAVIWNGASYECTCQNIDYDGIILKALGDVGYITGAARNGQPFVIVTYPLDVALRAGCGGEVHILDGSTAVTLSITQERAAWEFDGTEENYPEVNGVCNANCKYPVYTKTQIVSILKQLLEAGSLAGIDATQELSVRAIKETNGSKDISFWIGTEAQYNAITPAPAESFCMARVSADGGVYLCTDDTSLQDWHTAVVDDAAAAAAVILAEIQENAYTADNPPTAAECGAVPAEKQGVGVYSYDLLGMYLQPTLVSWDANTFNTPYKAGLTTATHGFAISYGDKAVRQIIVAWAGNHQNIGGGCWVYMTEDEHHYGWTDYGAAISSYNFDAGTQAKLTVSAPYYNKAEVTLQANSQAYTMYGTHNILCSNVDIAAGTAAPNCSIYQVYE